MDALPENWFPEHVGGEIAPLAQALLYPYPAPAGDFYMRDGLPVEAPQGIAPEALYGRVPVLSVGSNRAPLQLRRKFGAGASLPVTSCQLIDADVVFAASLSFYCAIPATACPSPGTVARLNVTWLDQAQLDHMHDTEAVGIAYDYVQIDAGVVNHGQRPADKVFDQPVFGYQARAGVLARDGSPVAQRGIAATGRQFAEADQAEMLTWARQVTDKDVTTSQTPLEGWITSLRSSRPSRDHVIAALAGHAHLPEKQPWQVVDAVSRNPDAFL